jgi:hypothetical protein
MNGCRDREHRERMDRTSRSRPARDRVGTGPETFQRAHPALADGRNGSCDRAKLRLDGEGVALAAIRNRLCGVDRNRSRRLHYHRNYSIQRTGRSRPHLLPDADCRRHGRLEAQFAHMNCAQFPVIVPPPHDDVTSQYCFQPATISIGILAKSKS